VASAGLRIVAPAAASASTASTSARLRVVGQRHAAAAAPLGGRPGVGGEVLAREQGQHGAADLEEADLVAGVVAPPAQARLVEAARAVEVGDAERHDPEALLHLSFPGTEAHQQLFHFVRRIGRAA
jgi:hypothetical protein